MHAFVSLLFSSNDSLTFAYPRDVPVSCVPLFVDRSRLLKRQRMMKIVVKRKTFLKRCSQKQNNHGMSKTPRLAKGGVLEAQYSAKHRKSRGSVSRKGAISDWWLANYDVISWQCRAGHKISKSQKFLTKSRFPEVSNARNCRVLARNQLVMYR
jgi:hypothetical protein